MKRGMVDTYFGGDCVSLGGWVDICSVVSLGTADGVTSGMGPFMLMLADNGV